MGMTRRPAAWVAVAVLAGAGTAWGGVREALLEGVSKVVAPGLPGALAVYGEGALVVVTAPNGQGVRLPVVAAAEAGKGRVVALAHNGYFSVEQAGKADTVRLLGNAISWAGGGVANAGGAPPVRGEPAAGRGRVVRTRHLDLMKLLGVEAKAIEAGGPLDPAEVVVMVAAEWPVERAGELAAFVRAGGGLVIADTGWGWAQLNPGKSLNVDNGGNAAVRELGLAFTTATTGNDGGGMIEVKAGEDVSALNALTALGRVREDRAARKPSAADTVAAAVLLTAHDAAPEGSAFAKRLGGRLAEVRGADPTPGAPLDATRPLARIKHLLELRRIATLPMREVRAHPSAAAFPGSVPANASRVTRTVKVDGSRARWHSTGLYAGPGEVISARVVSGGEERTLRLRIGAHTDDLTHLASWKRPPVITRSVAIGAAGAELANAFGGAVYVEVVEGKGAGAGARRGAQASGPRGGGTQNGGAAPPLPPPPTAGDGGTGKSSRDGAGGDGATSGGARGGADAGEGRIEVEISGAVEAPLFVLGETDVREWDRRIRHAPGPWAEMVVPGRVALTFRSDSIREMRDPTVVMEHWKTVLDAMAWLASIPAERPYEERIVTDVQISAGYMHAGYPIMTHLDVSQAIVDLPTLKTVKGGWGFYHELGHNHQKPEWTFEGTGEVTNNVFVHYVLETVCGLSAEEASVRALGVETQRLRRAHWADPEFARWQREPFLALGMYAQLHREFGWEAFRRAWGSYHDLPAGKKPRTEQAKRDLWLVTISRETGRDLGPFFDAWGVPVSEGAKAEVKGLPGWMPAEMRR